MAILVVLHLRRVYSAAHAANNIFQLLGHHTAFCCRCGLFWVGWVLSDPEILEGSGNLTIVLNVFSAFLLIIPVYQLVTYEIRANSTEKQGGTR
jgi:uncharacterized membrane protein